MDDLFELYVKTHLLAKGIKCAGLNVTDMLGISTHIGGPSVGFEKWCATMNISAPQPEPVITEEDIDDEIKSELNRQYFASSMGSDLQAKGILKVEKVG